MIKETSALILDVYFSWMTGVLEALILVYEGVPEVPVYYMGPICLDFEVCNIYIVKFMFWFQL